MRRGGDGEKERGRIMMEGTTGEGGRRPRGVWVDGNENKGGVWSRVKATVFIRGRSGKEPLTVAPSRGTHLPVLYRPLT